MQYCLNAASLYCYGDRVKYRKYLFRALKSDKEKGYYYFNLYVNRINDWKDTHPDTLFYRTTAEKLLKE